MTAKSRKKSGSVMLFVVLTFSVVFAIVTGLLAASAAALENSSAFYSKKSAYFGAESALEKILYYFDLAADDARKRANEYCYDKSGGFNIDSPDIKAVYDEMIADEILNSETSSEEEKNDRLEIYKSKVKKIFIGKYKKYINDFVSGSNTLYINGKDSQGNTIGDADWPDLKIKLQNDFNSTDFQITFARYGEADGTEFNEFKEGTTAENFEYLGTFNKDGTLNEDDTKISKYPRETFYIKSKTKDNSVKYLVATFEMNPFGVEYNKVGIKPAKIRLSFNRLLEYPVAAGRNLIAVNGNNMFTVYGDVKTGGTGNNLSEVKDYDTFGGVVAGMRLSTFDNLSNNATIDRISGYTLNETSGHITVYGNVYSGNVQKNNMGFDFLNTGFLRTVYDYSTIDIKKVNGEKGNFYGHSIVTGGDASNSTINIEGSSYIADNVTLDGSSSRIDIGENLIGFETADSDINYNQSPSVVVNRDDASLRIGKNVILFGVAFVDGLNRVSDNKIFRTVETSSIYPNYVAYTYPLSGFEGMYSTYKFEDSDTEVDMLDRDKKDSDGNPLVDIKDGVKFLLTYINESLKDNTGYYEKYKLGSNIDIGNFKYTDNIEDTSFVPFIFSGYTNGKETLFLSTRVDSSSEPVEDKLSDTMNANGKQLKLAGFDYAVVMSNLQNTYLKDIKDNIINIMYLKDKGLKDSKDIDDYLDFNAIGSDDTVIEDAENRRYICLTDNDFIFDSTLANKINGWDVLIVSGGNIILENTNSVTIKGNIIARGDIIAKGADFTINYDEQVSKRLSTIRGNDVINAVLSKGATADKTVDYELLGTFNRTVKSNIKLLSRRQIFK